MKLTQSKAVSRRRFLIRSVQLAAGTSVLAVEASASIVRSPAPSQRWEKAGGRL